MDSVTSDTWLNFSVSQCGDRGRRFVVIWPRTGSSLGKTVGRWGCHGNLSGDHIQHVQKSKQSQHILNEVSTYMREREYVYVHNHTRKKNKATLTGTKFKLLRKRNSSMLSSDSCKNRYLKSSISCAINQRRSSSLRTNQITNTILMYTN